MSTMQIEIRIIIRNNIITYEILCYCKIKKIEYSKERYITIGNKISNALRVLNYYWDLIAKLSRRGSKL